MNRTNILEQAHSYITKDRAATHGNAENSFKTIASLWSAYLEVEVKEHDVCAMMALLKLSRIKNNHKHLDSWIDLVGYGAIGGEISEGDE